MPVPTLRVSARSKDLPWNRLLVSDRVASLIDVMMVFPYGEQAGDKQALPGPGSDPQVPVAGSAAWYLNQVLTDHALFRSPLTQKSKSFDDENVPEGEATDMDIPSVAELYKAVLKARSVGELRELVLQLLVGYLLSGWCGFEVRVFTSSDGDELFVGISASESMLRAHADTFNYKLQLDAEVSAKLLGRPPFSAEILPPFVDYDVDDEEQYHMRFGRTPFSLHYESYKDGSIFVGSDRINIITSVIEKAFNTDGMLATKVMQAVYPCHVQNRLQLLSPSWAMPHQLADTFNVSVVRGANICSYFGSKLAFTAIFLRFLNWQVLPLAIPAPFLLFFLEDKGELSEKIKMAVGIILICWATSLGEFWKRKEAQERLKWGMDDLQAAKGRERPQFRGEWTLSDVDGITMVKMYPAYGMLIRRTISWTITSIFFGVMVAASLSLYHYQDILLTQRRKRMAILLNIAIALQMKVCDYCWDMLGRRLANFDNYRTDKEYKEALLQRTFGVRFIISFSSLFYIAFVKNFTVGCLGGESSCISQVTWQLRTIFLADMLGHCTSILDPYVRFCIKAAMERRAALRKNRPSDGVGYDHLRTPSDREAQDQGMHPSYVESQAHMPKYSLSEEIYDSMDCIVELGYVLFFGFVAPEIVFLFLLSNLLRVHVLGKKLVNAMRRPVPSKSAGLGTIFDHVFYMTSRLAVACNIILILLTTSEDPANRDSLNGLKELLSRPTEGAGRERDWKTLIVVFFVIDLAISLLRYSIDLVIPDVPSRVVLAMERREAIKTRLIAQATSELKKWEGRELERAHLEAPEHTKVPQVLREGTWKTARLEILSFKEQTSVRPWSSNDEHYEKAFHLSQR